MAESKRNKIERSDGSRDGDASGRALTPRQERLLGRYHDGECGLVCRFIAESLIARDPAARAFVDSLQEIRRATVERPALRTEVDLWSKVAARIAQEEHAAVFLGERRQSWGERLVGFVREHRHVAWGIPSGAALAGVLLFFMAPVSEKVGQGVGEMARVSNAGAPVVNLASAGGGGPVGRLSDPVEVDWVRGSGRVRVMQDPRRNSAIIWVRRPQSPQFLPGERFEQPTPSTGTPRAFR